MTFEEWEKRHELLKPSRGCEECGFGHRGPCDFAKAKAEYERRLKAMMDAAIFDPVAPMPWEPR